MSTVGETMRGMSKGKLYMMLATTLVMAGFFIVLAFRMADANMAPLYTNLSLEDSSKIVSELEKSSTPYQLTANGSQILVPADRVLRLRMTMASQGIPAGGNIVGYEIFDRSETFGSSNFVMNINMTRALEGELSRTIASITNVDSARVHLVMPKQELFSREKNKPTASVTVRMRGSHELGRAEVMSITHLMASAVPGLDSSRVTVVDGHGRLLARGDGNDSVDAAASSAQDYRIAYETRMQSTLEDLMEKVVGMGKVRVQVNAEMNFDRIVTNSEKYDPEGQVARSVQSSSKKENTQDSAGGGDVSVANNQPGGAAGSAGGNSSNQAAEVSDEVTNYEISKTVQNHITEGGTLKKISVAAIVDGVYTKAEDGTETYAPRSEEEMKQLKNLITTAIGFDEKRGDKIEIANMRFTQEGQQTEEESFLERFKIEMQSIIQTLIVAVVAILGILLVLRPAVTQLIKSAQAPSERVAGELAALEAPAAGIAGAAPGAPAGAAPRLPGAGAPPAQESPEIMIDVANIKGGMKSSSIKKINEIVDKYPEETMGVVRQWATK